ncbi:hypothetical protein HMSSN036_34430 [Paenibacillus macerans]|nr:hypothetical protein HMSSN036_34430 [Paenibacillus macerans]
MMNRHPAYAAPELHLISAEGIESHELLCVAEAVLPFVDYIHLREKQLSAKKQFELVKLLRQAGVPLEKSSSTTAWMLRWPRERQIFNWRVTVFRQLPYALLPKECESDVPCILPKQQLRPRVRERITVFLAMSMIHPANPAFPGEG